MYTKFKAAFAIAALASVPFELGAIPQQSVREVNGQTKEAHKTAMAQRTLAEEAGLAAYYRAKAQQTQRRLADSEDLMQRWSWMKGRTKMPNAYTHARSLVDLYRAEFQKTSKLANWYERMASATPTATATGQ